MKVITESILRDELRTSIPDVYVIPEGKILSPAAREFLQQKKVKIESNIKHKKVTISGDIPYNSRASAYESPFNKNYLDQFNNRPKAPDPNDVPVPGKPHPEAVSAAGPAVEVPVTAEGRTAVGTMDIPKAKYVDYETGAFYNDKPEYMTQLYGNKLVRKNHRRIVFRGYLDDLEADLLIVQTELMERGGCDVIVSDLEDVANTFREMMRADCLNDEFKKPTILGLDHDQLRERSHNPMKYYNIKQMLLPSKDLGRVYALLNSLRTKIRKTEVAAVGAYENGSTYERTDIIEELNRASSALHIMMCKYLAGDYNQ